MWTFGFKPVFTVYSCCVIRWPRQSIPFSTQFSWKNRSSHQWSSLLRRRSEGFRNAWRTPKNVCVGGGQWIERILFSPTPPWLPRRQSQASNRTTNQEHNRVLRDKSWGEFWSETNKKTKCRALKDALLYLVRVCNRFGSAKLVSGCSQERLL